MASLAERIQRREHVTRVSPTPSCSVCGETDCNAPGLHGVIRERARLAIAQRSPFVRAAQAGTLPPKVYR